MSATGTDTQTTQDYPDSWKPSTAGENISGKVVDIDTRDGGYGEYPIVTLEDEGGTRIAVHAFHTVLRQELAKRRPGMGTYLEITYLGKKNTEDGSKGYAAYKVGPDGAGGRGYNWAQDLDGGDHMAPVAPGVPPPIPAPIAQQAPAADEKPEPDDLPF